MTINTMRHIDRYVGIPLCWLLGFIQLLHQRNSNIIEQEKVHTILVIKFFGLGSILLTTPALTVIRSHFANARILYLTFESHRELLERLDIIDVALTIRTDNFRHFITDTLKAIIQLRKAKIDVVFDFEFFSKFSTILSFLSKSPVRAGFSLPAQWRKRLLTHSVVLTKEKHVVENFCEQVYALGAERIQTEVAVPHLSSDDISLISRKYGFDGKPIIAINVNAGKTFLERRWSPEKFAQLVDHLAERDGHVFVFIGSEEEKEYIEDVINQTECGNRCFNAAGIFSIGELLVVLKHSSLLVSNDSGPLHLAAGLGTPTVGLFGPETPVFYGPQNHHAISIYKKLPCSPCMNVYAAKTFRCPYNAQCMNSILVSDVKNTVETLFEYA